MWYGKGYLMYYRAMTLDKDDQSGADCVALSDDGVTWSKPKLGLVERAGDETHQGFLRRLPKRKNHS